MIVIEDWDNNEFRALMPLDAIPDRLLYVSRNVDGDILNLLDETRETARFYSSAKAIGAGCCSSSGCSISVSP